MEKVERTFKDASFDMSLDSGLVTVKRKLVFSGANIEFDIKLKPEGNLGEATIAELHQQSVKEVIALLQTMIPSDK